jgi:hypothetical protein
MMPRPTALALLAITLAAIHSAGVSEAVTLATMAPSCFAWSTDDPSQNNGDHQLLPARQLDGEAVAPAIARCADRDAPECASRDSDDRWDNTQQGERDFEALLSSENKVESTAFDVMIQISDWDVSRGPRSCTNLGGQAQSPGEDCSNVEAGSDYTETISILTAAIIAMLALALVPFAWVMHRSYRTWRLRRRSAVGKYHPVVR